MKINITKDNNFVCMVVPYFDRIGGYELQAFSLCKAYQQFGKKAAILTTSMKGFPRYEVREQVDIHRLPRYIEKFPVLLSTYLSYLFWKIKKTPYVFHCHAISLFTEHILYMNRYLKIPTLLKVATQGDVTRLQADLQADEKRRLEWRKNFERITFLSLNGHIRQELLDFDIRAEKIISISNGVDTTRFYPISNQEKEKIKVEMGFTKNDCLITFVGRFEERKRVADLIHAWGHIEKSYPQHRLVLVGDGAEKTFYEGLCYQLNISRRVTFMGLISCVEKILKISDLFVFPSRLEGLPNAVLEAMATELPILSTNIPGINEVIEHEKTGFLVPPQNELALIDGLNYLLLNPHQAKGMGMAARKKILSNYCFSKIAPKFFEIYQNLMA